MTKPIIRIYTTVDEYIDREMTADEYKVYESDLAQLEARKAEAEAKLTEKAALLKRLGITAEEAALLLS
jgi:hypothetical protein